MEPDLRYNVYMPDGVLIPQGKKMNIIDAYMKGLAFYVRNEYSEYVVY